MGLSSLPSPSEGVLCVILVNTAISLSVFKGIMRSILHIVGIRLASTPSDSIDSPPDTVFRLTPSESFMEEFRSKTPTVKFGSIFSLTDSDHHDCLVCLSRFESESEVNHLSCGHVYHKTCLEKWLDYWKNTCPLCRTPLMPDEEDTCVW